MDYTMLMLEKPTAQVRILACEFLKDGGVHARKKIIEYVKNKGHELGLPSFREGHIAGGIQQALTNMNCESVGYAKYRARIEQSETPDFTIPQRAEQICKSTKEQLITLSREIEYVNACEKEIQQLELLRKCVEDVQTWQDKFAEMSL